MLAEWALFCGIDRDAETPCSKKSRLTGGWLASEPVPSSAEDGDDATESSDSRANGRAARRERRRGGADAAVEEEAAPASATDAPQPKSRRELRRAATEEAAPAAAVPAVSESGDEESAADAKPKRSRFRRLAQKSPPSSPVKEKLSLKGRLAAARGGWSADQLVPTRTRRRLPTQRGSGLSTATRTPSTPTSQASQRAAEALCQQAGRARCRAPPASRAPSSRGLERRGDGPAASRCRAGRPQRALGVWPRDCVCVCVCVVCVCV